ncbi:glycosyltransferase family 4 protein [Methanothermobacter sp.]|uniref:glycosyltransferase family 4 protein n=1 Tax=Methanothermobacter sp. TaxID=1884223 RepID=UPI003C765D4E
MRVLIVSHCFYPFIGGLEEVAFQQAKGLVERGHDVWVVTSDIGNNEKLKKKEKIDGIMVYRVSASSFLYKNFDIPQPIFNIFELRSILKDLCQYVDLVHVHDRYYLSSILATKVAKKFNKPIILTVHTGCIKYESPLYNILFNFNEKLSSYVVKNSLKILSLGSEIREYILEKFERESLSFSNAVDTTFFTPSSGNSKARNFKVLFVGRFTYKKGVDYIVSLAKKLNKCTFICIGDGPRFNEIKNLIAKENIQNIILKGSISDKNVLKDHYKDSDVFIFPSRGGEASSPLVMLEALASGLPIIVKNSGGHAGMIRNGVTGFVVENVDEMIEKIDILSKNEDLLRKMSLNAREDSKRFSWSKNVDRLISVYNSVIEG